MASDISNKIKLINDAKIEIAQAITDVGEPLNIKAYPHEVFRDYADKIRAIGHSIWSSADDSEEQHLLITENGYYDVNELSKKYFDDPDKYNAVSSFYVSVQSSPVYVTDNWLIAPSEDISADIPASIPHQAYSSINELSEYFGGSNGIVILHDNPQLALNLNTGYITYQGSNVLPTDPLRRTVPSSGIAVKYEDQYGGVFYGVVKNNSTDGELHVFTNINIGNVERYVMPFSSGPYQAAVSIGDAFAVGYMVNYCNYFSNRMPIFVQVGGLGTRLPISKNVYLGPYEQPSDSFGPKTIECDGRTLTNISGPVWIAS